MTILDMLEKDGIETRRVASTNGGEYAGPCPICGGKDRFRCWPEKGDGGSWWCRTENKGGDCIQYLKDVRGMGYKEACLFLGRKPETMKRSFDWGRSKNKLQWKSKETTSPNEIWLKKSSLLVDWCHKQLISDAGKNTLSYLKKERGFTEETIKTFRLGCNPDDARAERKAWGLPEALNDKGKPKKVYIPAGIVIPCFVDGLLQKVKIRLQDRGEKNPPYLPIPGGYTGPHIIGNNHKVCVIVESELCGILLHQEIGNLAGVIVLGSAYNRPDKGMVNILQKAELLLIALDSEPHKKDNTGAKQSWTFWLKHFNQAKRWPPIDGKDPGEMWKNGVNLQMWIQAGIEEYQIKQESMAEPSAMETALDLKSSMPVTTDDPGQNFIIKLHSDLTGEDFYLCSTQRLKDECRANDPDTVVYLPHEIRNLSGLKPDELKKLHHVRKVFGGEFIQINKTEDSIFATQEDEKIRNAGIYNPRLLNKLGS